MNETTSYNPRLYIDNQTQSLNFHIKPDEDILNFMGSKFYVNNSLIYGEFDGIIFKIKDNIVIARVGLLLRHPFFGNLATRLTIKEGGDWCKTAATDGRHIFFNKEFFEALSVDQIKFVLAHEIMHNVFDHMGRRDGRHPRIFNYAGDYCVNGQLVRDNIGDHVIDGIQILLV